VLRERDTDKKQGSKSTPIQDNQLTVLEIDEFQNMALDFYQSLLDKRVAPEIARGVLPQSMYTEFIETGSLAAYARLCGLRLNPHAQSEIRAYAGAVSAALMEKFPVSWKALNENMGSS
jgi:thymidylate synthase (FAD)